MAEMMFVIYATTAGTATARPVLEYYNDEDTHVPDIAVLGHSTSSAAWIAVEPFDVTDTPDEATGRALTINPTTGLITEGTFARGDVATAQLAHTVKVNSLINKWNWTQMTDARISRSTQQAFADWMLALEALEDHALWSTNPAALVFPPVPSIVWASSTVAQQVAAATWADDAAMPAQKLNIANWGTLQPVWGFDWDDLGVFVTGGPATLSWVTGRSGTRALRVNVPGGVVQAVSVRARPPYSFAMAPGDTFYVEAWVRGTAGLVVNVGLVGFETNLLGSAAYNGGDGSNEVSATPSGFTRVSGYIQVPSGNPIRWGTAEVSFFRAITDSAIEIDSLTVTRVPRLPNAYTNATAAHAVTYTGTALVDDSTVLTLDFFRGGAGATVKLTASARITAGNLTTDVMRLTFWLSRRLWPAGPLEQVTAWAEHGNGQGLHRATGFEFTDATADNKKVTYALHVSRNSNSTGDFTITNRQLSAILLPKL